MNKPLVLFVGIVRRGEFESLKHQGLAVGVIIDTNWALKLPEFQQLDAVYSYDFNKPQEDLLLIVEQIQKEWTISCVLVTHEFYILAGALITEHLGLEGVYPETALVCNDKALMHERFMQRIGPNSTAYFQRITSVEDLRTFSERTPFPIILKPSNLAGSLFITLNSSFSELLQSYTEMSEAIPHFFSNGGWNDGQVHIQAEEFLQGTTHSIDLIINKVGQVIATPFVDELTGHECGWNDFHIFARYLPSRLTPSEQEAAYQLALQGIVALDIRSSVAHVELIQTAQGPRLLEIGVRFGGYRPELFERSYGYDVVYPYYQVRSGQTPDPVPDQQGKAVAILTPGTKKEGILQQINFLDRIQQLPTYVYHEVKAQIGQKVGPSTRGFYAPLGIVLTSEQPEMMYRDIQEIQSWSDIFVIDEPTSICMPTDVKEKE